MMLARQLRGRPVTVITASLAVLDVLRDDDAGRAGGARRRAAPHLPLPGRRAHRGRPAPGARRPRLPRRERRPRRRAGPRHHGGRGAGQARPDRRRRPGRAARPTGTSCPAPGRCGCAASSDIDVLVTNDGADPDTLEACAAAGVEVLLVVRLAILGGGGFRVPLVYGALLRDTSEPPGRRGASCTTSTRRGSPPSGTCSPQMARRRTTTRRGSPTTTDLDDGARGRRLRLLGDPRRRPGRAHRRRAGRARPRACSARRPPVRAAWPTACAPSRSPSTSPNASRALAPAAWVINFTNPAGMITEAMQQVLGDRVIGICDSPIGLGRRAAAALGLDPDRTSARLRRAQPPRLAARPAPPAARRPARPARRRRACSARSRRAASSAPTGCAPSARSPTSTSTTTTSPARRSRRSAAAPRPAASSCSGQQHDFYAAVAARPPTALATWDRVRARARRDVHGGGPARRGARSATPPTSRAAATRAWRWRSWRPSPAASAASMILNVRNGATPCPGCRPRRVVEVPCTVDADGPQPAGGQPADRPHARSDAAGQGGRAARPSRPRASRSGEARRGLRPAPAGRLGHHGPDPAEGYRARIPEVDALLR